MDKNNFSTPSDPPVTYGSNSHQPLDFNSPQNPLKDLDSFIEEAGNLKKDHKLDLSSDQDLSIAIMNLVSIEEHFFFTGAKTDNPQYYQFLKTAREMRKELLKKIVKDYEGEVWCISKHLLAASMRLMEVGTKYLGQGKDAEAQDFFKKAYELYSLFWGLNMNVISAEGVKKIDDDAINKHEKKPQGFLGKMGELVKRAIDCCIE